MAAPSSPRIPTSLNHCMQKCISTRSVPPGTAASTSTPDAALTAPCRPLLQELHLDQTFVTADGLAGVLESCQELRSLSVGARGSSSWPAPAGPLQGLCLPSQAPINSTLLTSVAAHCKSLEELRISGELPTHPVCESRHSSFCLIELLAVAGCQTATSDF